jgi:hypothetical protein
MDYMLGMGSSEHATIEPHTPPYEVAPDYKPEAQKSPEAAGVPDQGLYGRLIAAREHLTTVDREVDEFLEMTFDYDVWNIGRRVYEQLPLDPEESSKSGPWDAVLKTDDGRTAETKAVSGTEVRHGFFVGADGRRVRVDMYDTGVRYTAADPNDTEVVKAAYECGATESSRSIVIQDPEAYLEVEFRDNNIEISRNSGEEGVATIYRSSKTGKGTVVFNGDQNVGDPLEIVRRTIDFVNTAILKPVTSAAPMAPQPAPAV